MRLVCGTTNEINWKPCREEKSTTIPKTIEEISDNCDRFSLNGTLSQSVTETLRKSLTLGKSICQTDEDFVGRSADCSLVFFQKKCKCLHFLISFISVNGNFKFISFKMEGKVNRARDIFSVPYLRLACADVVANCSFCADSRVRFVTQQ